VERWARNSQSAHVGAHKLTCKHFTTGTLKGAAETEVELKGHPQPHPHPYPHPHAHAHPRSEESCSRFEVQFSTATDFPALAAHPLLDALQVCGN